MIQPASTAARRRRLSPVPVIRTSLLPSHPANPVCIMPPPMIIMLIISTQVEEL